MIAPFIRQLNIGCLLCARALHRWREDRHIKVISWALSLLSVKWAWMIGMVDNAKCCVDSTACRQDYYHLTTVKPF